jgi:hypothetical protein
VSEESVRGVCQGEQEWVFLLNTVVVPLLDDEGEGLVQQGVE